MKNVTIQKHRFSVKALALLSLPFWLACDGVNRNRSLLQQQTAYQRTGMNAAYNPFLAQQAQGAQTAAGSNPFARSQIGGTQPGPGQVASPSFNDRYRHQPGDALPVGGESDAAKKAEEEAKKKVEEEKKNTESTDTTKSEEKKDVLNLGKPSWTALCENPGAKPDTDGDGISDACEDQLKNKFPKAEKGDVTKKNGFKIGVYEVKISELNDLVKEKVASSSLSDGEKSKITSLVDKKDHSKTGFMGISGVKKDAVNMDVALLVALDSLQTSGGGSEQVLKDIISKARIVDMRSYNKDNKKIKVQTPVVIRGDKDEPIFSKLDHSHKAFRLADISGVYGTFGTFAQDSAILVVAEGNIETSESIELRLFNLADVLGGLKTLRQPEGLYTVFESGELKINNLELTEDDGVPSVISKKLTEIRGEPSMTLSSGREQRIVSAMFLKNTDGDKAIGNALLYRSADDSESAWEYLAQPLSSVGENGEDSIFTANMSAANE